MARSLLGEESLLTGVDLKPDAQFGEAWGAHWIPGLGKPGALIRSPSLGKTGAPTRSPVWGSLGRQPDPQFGESWGANQIPQSGGSLGCQPDPQFGAAWGANQTPQFGEDWSTNPIPSLGNPGALIRSLSLGEAWDANPIPSLGQPGVLIRPPSLGKTGAPTRSPVWGSLGRQPDPQFGESWGANQIPQSGGRLGCQPDPQFGAAWGANQTPQFGEDWSANPIPSLGKPGVPVKDTLAAITSRPPHFSGFARPEFVFGSVAPSRRKAGGFSSRRTQGPGCSCLWLRHPPAALCSQLAGRAEAGGAGVGGFYEQLGFHLHSVTWPHLTARDAGRGGRRKRKGGGGQPADRPRTRRPRDCPRDTVRHPPADEHANLTAAPPAPRCLELRLEQRSLGSPPLPSLSKPRQQRLRRRASRLPTPHPRGRGGGGFPCPWNQQTREETAERGSGVRNAPSAPVPQGVASEPRLKAHSGGGHSRKISTKLEKELPAAPPLTAAGPARLSAGTGFSALQLSCSAPSPGLAAPAHRDRATKVT
ncbi:uncharacterized protein LOC131499215 [Neofelis nebulosa]|uniref:uncharacterized protein LOC131499215 n=1 Tax=Neofelis nebulosa TaxID=61452 RepID=UPI00272D3E53|nr:uncharacterized protein LOC131499215 [Neofelis nebulosa]